MKAKEFIFILITLIVIEYLLFSFVVADLNPFNWHELYRGFLSVIWLITIYVIIQIASVDCNDEL